MQAGRRAGDDAVPHRFELRYGRGACAANTEQAPPPPKVRRDAERALLDDPAEFAQLEALRDNAGGVAWSDAAVKFARSEDGVIDYAVDGDVDLR